MHLHAEVGDVALEVRVLIFQRPQTPGLAHVHSHIIALPSVVGLLADVVRSRGVANSYQYHLASRFLGFAIAFTATRIHA